MCVDVRGCSPGYPSPAEGIFTEYVRKSGEGMDRRPLQVPLERKPGEIRRFSREREGTRGAVLNRKRPNFPTRTKRSLHSLYIAPACEI